MDLSIGNSKKKPENFSPCTGRQYLIEDADVAYLYRAIAWYFHSFFRGKGIEPRDGRGALSWNRHPISFASRGEDVGLTPQLDGTTGRTPVE
jgi:hypothetical protein